MQVGQLASLTPTIKPLLNDICCISGTQLQDSSGVIQLTTPGVSSRYSVCISVDETAPAVGQRGKSEGSLLVGTGLVVVCGIYDCRDQSALERISVLIIACFSSRYTLHQTVGLTCKITTFVTNLFARAKTRTV